MLRMVAQRFSHVIKRAFAVHYANGQLVDILALAGVDALPTAACAMIDMLVEESCLNQDVPPQPCEG